MTPVDAFPLFDALGATHSLEAGEVFLTLLVAFILGMVTANVYRFTHQGFSFQRTFLHTLVLAHIVIAVMIMAIGNNMARGLGILGAMAFIRFRSAIRDPRDVMFLFISLATGIACGAQVFMVAICGTLFFGAVSFYLALAPFASRREFEGLLRFMLSPDSPCHQELGHIFSTYCARTEVIATREAIQGEMIEYAYQVRLLDPTYKTDLIDAVSKLPDSQEVSLVMQRTTVEI